MSDYPMFIEKVCLNCEDKFELEKANDSDFCCNWCRRQYYNGGYNDSYNFEEFED